MNIIKKHLKPNKNSVLYYFAWNPGAQFLNVPVITDPSIATAKQKTDFNPLTAFIELTVLFSLPL